MPPLLDRITPLDTLSLASRRVLVRVDFDAPLGRDGAVSDDARVREALPTLQHLVAQGARVVVASHLGRPRKGFNAAQSLAAPGERLAELLSMDIALTDECVGDGARKVVHDLRDGRVALLAELLDVPTASVKLLRGQSGRDKDVLVHGAAARIGTVLATLGAPAAER